MNMQAWIGQATFNCRVGHRFVWLECCTDGCHTRIRAPRDHYGLALKCVNCREQDNIRW